MNRAKKILGLFEEENIVQDLIQRGYRMSDTNFWGDRISGVRFYTKTFRTEDEAREAWERFNPYLYSNKIVSSETMRPQKRHPELKWTHEVGVKNG